MKSEPDECSIDDLARAPRQTVPWTGVRNYQARNYMRDAMAVGDGVLFYHSSCAQPGIAGIARVAGPAHPDPTQFDPRSRYVDPAADRSAPRWSCVDVAFVARTRLLSLAELRGIPALAGMQVLRRGNRLSITPLQPREWATVLELLEVSWPST